MDSTLVLVVIIIGVALIFDFINGFHDAANSIATIVSTRVLRPVVAVGYAAFWNFVAAFAFDTKVAKTVGAGLVDLNEVTSYVILAGLVGAVTWDLLTWWWGLPTSSSHALYGGYAGAAMAHVAFTKGFSSSLDALVLSGWAKILVYIIIGPLLGMAVAYLLMLAVLWAFRRRTTSGTEGFFRWAQLVSSAFLSFSHGTNDAQKTMGIITGVLVTSGYLPRFEVPVWVIFAAHAAIGLGTLSGGWRIVRTMGSRLTRLRPRGGFCAETGAAISISIASFQGIGVSTTHVTAGAIAGVGTVRRPKAVRWSLAQSILWAWVLTIPASALVGWLTMLLFHLVVPGA